MDHGQTTGLTRPTPGDAAADTAPDTGALDDAALGDWSRTDLHERPGVLIRRMHQIHMALFSHECAGEGITPVQYSVLTALYHMGPSEQIAVSRAVGLDRTSTADVMRRLEQRKLVRRRVSATDRRSKITSLTDVGQTLLTRIEASAARAHARTIAPLTPAEQDQLMTHMKKIIAAYEGLERKSG